MSRIKVDRITDKAGTGAPTLVNGMNVTGKSTMGDIVGAAVTFNSITGGSANFSSDVSIGGTLTYEDVKNVDSVGLITARSGINITGGDLNAVSNLILKVDGTERVRTTTAGNFGINDNNPANQLVVKAPGGSGHCAAKVLSGDASTSMFLQSIQGSEGRLGVESNHPLALYAGTSERLRIGTVGQIGINGANYGTSGQVMTSQGGSAAPQWAEAGGGAWEVVSTHALTGSTSYIDSNGWSNSYAMYKLMMHDIYYGGTLFKVYLRIYQDSTSGNAGTLKFASQYGYGAMDGQEAWGGISAVPRQGTWSTAHKLGYNRDITELNMGEYDFPMQTNVSSGNTYPYWSGRLSRNANMHLADSSIYNADKTEFMTGIRLYFYDSSGVSNISPTQGRVTILRMKYS